MIENQENTVDWVDPTTGLECRIIRHEWGHLCGYVSVPAYLWHLRCSDPLLEDITVHGGLTFTGEMDQRYWLGFDCAHSGDYVPRMDSWADPKNYKDFFFVRKEVTQLAKQIEETEWYSKICKARNATLREAMLRLIMDEANASRTEA